MTAVMRTFAEVVQVAYMRMPHLTPWPTPLLLLSTAWRRCMLQLFIAVLDQSCWLIDAWQRLLSVYHIIAGGPITRFFILLRVKLFDIR